MGQVTIYLEEEIELKMIAAARSARQSKSKWIAGIIQAKVANEWPKSIENLAGSWSDFPSLKEIRSSIGEDAVREQF